MDIKWRLKMLEIIGAVIIVNIVLGVVL
jgi:hypothetical protein